MPRKLKKQAGMTLLEVLIALALLSVIVAPVLGMFVTGTRLTTASYKLTSASVTAQMRMEELVGLDKDELSGELGTREYYNGFEVEAERTETGFGFENLIEVTVTVYDSDGTSVLATQTNILNVALGGVVKEAGDDP